MPFDSAKQRRYLFATKPEVAKQIAYKNSGGFVTVTMGDQEFTVTDEGVVINDQGEVVTDTPQGQNAIAKAAQGYTQEQAQDTADRQERNREGFLATTEFVLGVVNPIIGTWQTIDDIETAIEEEDYTALAIMAGAFAAGFLAPGAARLVGKGILAIRKIIPEADILGIARAIKDGDIEFLKSYKAPAGSVGARVAKPRTIYIRDIDGTVTEVSGTNKELVEQFGISENILKKAARDGGNLPDGRVWSKSGDFTDARTTAGKKAEPKPEVERVNPNDPTVISQMDNNPKQARLPKSTVSNVERDELERIVDEEIVEALDELGISDDDYYEAGTDWLDYSKRETLSVAVREEAWPEILERLQRFHNKDNDTFNKIIAWARRRAVRVFDTDFGLGAHGRLTGVERSASREIGVLRETLPADHWFHKIDMQEFSNRYVDVKSKNMLNRFVNSNIVEIVDKPRNYAVHSEQGLEALEEIAEAYNRVDKFESQMWLDERDLFFVGPGKNTIPNYRPKTSADSLGRAVQDGVKANWPQAEAIDPIKVAGLKSQGPFGWRFKDLRGYLEGKKDSRSSVNWPPEYGAEEFLRNFDAKGLKTLATITPPDLRPLVENALRKRLLKMEEDQLLRTIERNQAQGRKPSIDLEDTIRKVKQAKKIRLIETKE